MGRHGETPVVVIERSSGGFSGFVLGALAGAAVALLMAPRTGEETRAELRDGVRRLRDRADDTMRGMQDAVGETFDSVRETVGERIDQARDAFESGRQSARDARVEMERRARETRERLRAGIDAARQPVEPTSETGAGPAAESEAGV